MRLREIIQISILLITFSASIASAGSAPEFSLNDMTGATVTLSQFKGKVVFLDFWASWCPACKNSIPEVEKLFENSDRNSVVVIGVNVGEPPEVVKKFITSKGIKYNVLQGADQTEKEYQLTSIPSFFIIDQEGAIVSKNVGFKSGMEAEWESEIARLTHSSAKKDQPGILPIKRNPQ